MGQRAPLQKLRHSTDTQSRGIESLDSPLEPRLCYPVVYSLSFLIFYLGFIVRGNGKHFKELRPLAAPLTPQAANPASPPVGIPNAQANGKKLSNAATMDFAAEPEQAQDTAEQHTE